MLIALHESAKSETKCSKTTTVLSELTAPKTMDVSYILIVLEINRLIYCIEIYHSVRKVAVQRS
jgi:hypothetical protein